MVIIRFKFVGHALCRQQYVPFPTVPTVPVSSNTAKRVGFPTRNPKLGAPPLDRTTGRSIRQTCPVRIDGGKPREPPAAVLPHLFNSWETQLFCFREAPWIIDLTMLGGLCLCRSGRFFDGVNFVHYLDAAVVLCLASGVVIATRDVERRTTLPLPVTASLARTVTQYSQ